MSPSVDQGRRSPNHGERRGFSAPDCLVLHYTGMRNADAAIDWLCNPASQVSCHYVVTESGAILSLVDEDRRAWHAGRSTWQGETDINSASIGIEIVNGGHDHGLPHFPDVQIDAVIALCQDIMDRRSIASRRVLAHSDIAPGRKQDPGERFPWPRLALAGVGLWPELAGVVASVGAPASAVVIQEGLRAIGYGVPTTGVFDAGTAVVLQAFQRRYRPGRIDGIADHDTADLIAAVRALHRANR